MDSKLEPCATYTILCCRVADPVVGAEFILETGVFARGGFGRVGHFDGS